MSKAGWGYIGVPNGFQHISEGYTANSNIDIVDNRICHPDFADESVFAVIFDTAVTKSRDSKQLMTYFAEYRFAREIERTRTGSFYGSYVAFPRAIPNDLKSFKDIILLLDFFSSNLNEEFITNYKFNTEFSKDNSIVKIDGLDSKLSEMIGSLSARPVEKINKRQVIVYCDDPAEVFFNSQELYEQYSVIYSVSDRAYLNQIVKDNNIVEKTIEDLKKETAQVLEERKRLLAEENTRREKEINKIDREAEPQRKLLENSENDFDLVQALTHHILRKKLEQTERNKEHIRRFGEIDRDLQNEDVFYDLEQADKESIFNQLGASIIFLKNISDTLESEYKSLNSQIRQTNPEFFESEEFIDISAHSNKNSRNEFDNQGFNRPRPQPVQYDYDDEPSRFKKRNIVIIALLLVAIIVAAFYLVFNAKELFNEDKDDKTQISSIEPSGKVDEEKLSQDSLNNSETEDAVAPITSQDRAFVDAAETNSACSFESNNLRTYTVQQSDILDNNEQLRPNEDIVTQIESSILNKEGITLDKQKREQFRKTLISCNTSLDTSKLHEPKIEQLQITRGTKITYKLIK